MDDVRRITDQRAALTRVAIGIDAAQRKTVPLASKLQISEHAIARVGHGAIEFVHARREQSFGFRARQ